MVEACVDRLLSVTGQHTSCHVCNTEPWKVACWPGQTHRRCLAVPCSSVRLPNYFLETPSLGFLYTLPP